MRKTLLIGLVLCVVALGSMGAAFAAGLGFPNGVGALSLGQTWVPTVNADYVGFNLSSAYTLPVTVNGVYISLDQTIAAPNAVSVSLRRADGTELAYYAGNNVAWAAATTYLVPMTADGNPLPTADQVFQVKVVVATNSSYNNPALP